MRQILRSPALAFKFASDGPRGIIEGYASTFGGKPDLGGDVVAKGAFAATLKQHAKDGTRPAMLWQHDGKQPIGVWESITEDAHGLRVKGKLTLEVPRARDAFALARDGALGLSIAYRPIKTQPLRGVPGARLLMAVNVFEISLVAMPMNSSARITSVKFLRPNLADALRATARTIRKLKRKRPC